MRLRVAPFALLKRLALRLLLIAAVFWGGGIALFSVLPVPFSAVMLERQDRKSTRLNSSHQH